MIKFIDKEITRKVLRSHRIETQKEFMSYLKKLNIPCSQSKVSRTFEEYDVKRDKDNVYRYPDESEREYHKGGIEKAFKMGDISKINHVSTVFIEADPETVYGIALHMKGYMDDIVLHFDVGPGFAIMYVKKDKVDDFMNECEKIRKDAQIQMSQTQINQQKKIKLEKKKSQ